MKAMKGFTLFELLISMFITFIVMFSVGVTGGYWINNSKVNSVQAKLLESVNRGKSLALRNEAGVFANEPAIYLINDGSLLKLCNKENCSSVLWESELPTNVSIKFGQQVLACMVFDNQGLPLVHNDCITSQDYNIEAKDISVTGSL